MYYRTVTSEQQEIVIDMAKYVLSHANAILTFDLMRPTARTASGGRSALFLSPTRLFPPLLVIEYISMSPKTLRRKANQTSLLCI